MAEIVNHLDHGECNVNLTMGHCWLLVEGQIFVDIARLKDSNVFFIGAVLDEKLLHVLARYEDKPLVL